MNILNLTLKTKDGTLPLNFSVKRMVNAGFVGRNREAVLKHVKELEKEGVSMPAEVPALYPVASDMVSSQDVVEVVEGATNGEAEYVLLLQNGRTYVGVGSDHTDRKLESISILKSKQICPNIISPVVWLYEDLKNDWDSLVLKSWIKQGSQKILYQEAKLGAILNVEDLISLVKGKAKDGDMEGMIIYSGTVAALGGQMLYGDGFEVELRNPRTGDSLRCEYEVKLLDYLK